MSIRKLMLAAVILVSLAACSTPTPQNVEVTRVVEKTVLVTQLVEIEKVITATPVPATPAPAVMATLPTAAPATDDFNAWCTPNDANIVDASAQTGEMPDGARPLTYTDEGEAELIIQVKSCTFVYSFSSPVPAGTKLVVYDVKDNPFLETDLSTTSAHPNKAIAVVTSSAITDPGAWYVTYRIDALDPQGKVLRSDEVTFKRGWKPQPCYGGVWPDAITGRCPDLGEAHPWDPWYGYSPYGGLGEGVSTPGPIMKHPSDQ